MRITKLKYFRLRMNWRVYRKLRGKIVLIDDTLHTYVHITMCWRTWYVYNNMYFMFLALSKYTNVLHIFLICFIHVHFTQRVWTFNGIKKRSCLSLGGYLYRNHIISRITSPYIKSQLENSLYNLFLACVGVLDRRYHGRATVCPRYPEMWRLFPFRRKKCGDNRLQKLQKTPLSVLRAHARGVL